MLCILVTRAAWNKNDKTLSSYGVMSTFLTIRLSEYRVVLQHQGFIVRKDVTGTDDGKRAEIFTGFEMIRNSPSDYHSE